MTGNERLIRYVFSDHRLTDSVWADQDDVSRLLHEVERQDCFDGSTIASRRPVPIEFVERLKSPEARGLESSLEAAANVFLFLPLYERLKPGCFGDLIPMRE